MNIVITGHTSGIGKAIYELYGGIGLSRSNGFDITTSDITQYIDKDSVFINNAYTNKDPLSQVRLLHDSVEMCKQVICIGTNTRNVGKYQSAKNVLKQECEWLYGQGHNVTYLALGKVDTPHLKHYNGKMISPEYVAQMINFIITSPHRVEILSIRPD